MLPSVAQRLGSPDGTKLLAEQFQPGPLGLGPVRQRGERVVDLGEERRRRAIIAQVMQHSREPEHDLKSWPGTQPQPAAP